MPHQCTSCGYLFEDGSKAMLSGCPDCGGNTFQFHPKGAAIPEIPDDEPPDPEGGTVGDTVGRATNAVRGLVNRGDQPAGAPDNHDDLDDAVDDSARRDSDLDPTDPADSNDPTDSNDPIDPTDPTEPPNPTEPSNPTDPAGQPDPADQESVQSEEPGPAHASTGVASGAGDAAAEADNGESPEYGRDADVEHAPWPSENAEDGGSRAARDAAPTEGSAQSASDDGIGDEGVGDDGIIDADAREGNTAEDVAQASARTEFVGPDELPGREGGSGDADDGGDVASGPPGGPPSNGRVVREPTGEQPSLDELRQELNDQFESIKIVNPGEYELNLMELYNREEYVVALQENGRYVIQMPENWMQNRDGD